MPRPGTGQAYADRRSLPCGSSQLTYGPFGTIRDGSTGTITGVVSLSGTNKVVDVQCDSPTDDTVSIDALITALEVNAVN